MLLRISLAAFLAAAAARADVCSSAPPLRVRFFDVGQGLSALVSLPDGRKILIDTGTAKSQVRRYYDALKKELGGKPIDMLWITHQHVDHVGGADELMRKIPVRLFVDNGRTLNVSWVAKARAEARAKNVPIKVVGPGATTSPLPSSATVRLTPIVPPSWPNACAHDENECSIGLRIDFCRSSILFTGDAEEEEEELLDPRGPATLLQLGHHGSDTSTSQEFLDKVRPRYVVISAGKPGERANLMYCHPRVSTLERVTRSLGGPGSKAVTGFDASVKCNAAQPANWKAVKVSDRVYATVRDGDLIFTTRGNGVFKRLLP